MKYETTDARVLFVSQDWLDGLYRTFWQTANGSLYRVRSKDLPPRETMEAAQADLDEYARKNRFPEVEE